MKKEHLKLQQYIFRTQLIMIIMLAVILGTVGIFINLKNESRQRDRNLQNVAEAIAHSDPVSMAARGERVDLLADYLDSLIDSLNDIDAISVVGENNLRLYHSNHALIGTMFDGTMPDFETNGNYYSVDENGPSGPQRRAYAAIVSDNGEQTGFVMTIMLMSNIREKTVRTLIIFAVLILAVILIELVISTRISKKIRHSLMGYEPDAFSAMFNVRDNILEALSEGIIAVNEDGETEYVNQSAKTMLMKTEDGAVPDQAGKNLLQSTLETGEKEMSVPVNSSLGVNIIMDRIPVKKEEHTIGAVGILHNRTEYTKLAEDLAGTRFLVDSMRANNHDFTNKLHVILGLLQMEMYEEARQYIENITIVQRETISEIMHKVASPTVAALLIGKNARASELNIRFHFKKGSLYDPVDLYIPEDVLVTVIGNLIDNAYDAMNASAGGEKELWFGIFSKPGSLVIMTDDTGPGISEKNLEHIFENGFSTKGEGRGTGLYQVKKLVEAWGGTITVQSQEGSGTSFMVSFTKEEKAGEEEDV